MSVGIEVSCQPYRRSGAKAQFSNDLVAVLNDFSDVGGIIAGCDVVCMISSSTIWVAGIRTTSGLEIFRGFHKPISRGSDRKNDGTMVAQVIGVFG